jgi:transposase
MRAESLDQMLPPEHPVRAVWNLVCELDTSAFVEEVGAVTGQAGAPAFDPRVLITLWLQATLDGIGSARELSRLCQEHLVYRWICGGQPINHHTLSDFRVGRSAALDALLTQTAATLCAAGVASLARVAQDGVRVRANAGSGSFRRAATVADHLVEAEAQVAALKSQVDEDGGAAARRSQAARARTASERVERLRQARTELAKIQADNARRAATPKNRRQAKDPEQLRVSTTDPEARRMKMGDGGFRPAYNVQFAATTTGGVVVGVRVTNAGSDAAELEPMLKQLQNRYRAQPREVLVDGGFATHDLIERLDAQGIATYTPQKHKTHPDKPCRRRDPPAVARWRQRMDSEAGKEIYKQRAATAEWVNALARNRGLQQFGVRGLDRVTAVATWYAVAHNIHRAMRHRP